MEYQDFTIEVCSTEQEGVFEARVVEPAEEGAKTFPFPKPIEEDALKTLLEIQDKRASPANRSDTAAPDLLAFGHHLYRSVFCDELAERFSRCRGVLASGNGGCGLRLRVRFDLNDPKAGYLAALPWELLRDSEFLAANPGTPVVRDVVRSTPRGTFAVKGPLRILVVGAAVPGTVDDVAVKQETDRIVKIWRSLEDNGQADLQSLKVVSLDRLRNTLRDPSEPVHILHFVGHGGYNAVAENGAVAFVRPNGKTYRVNAETLADHLKAVPELRLVVLNSCKTARHAGRAGAPFNFGVAAAILERTSVQAVVAHQYTISFEAALRFSEIFYSCLAVGDEVDRAITETRLRLQSQSDEWSTPVLFLATRDGKLFDFAPGQPLPPGPSSRPASEPVRLGIRSFVGYGKDMDERNDKVLDFPEIFDGRFIKKEQDWQGEVFPRLQRFLATHAEERRPLVLDFAAHSSIAFAAGWLLEAKSGLDVQVRQRMGGGGECEWDPEDHEKHPVPEGPLWLDEPDLDLASGQPQPDIAVALAVSQPGVADHVEAYVRRKNLPVGRILRATIAPGPGPRSVAGGAHCLLLAQALVSRIRELRPHERGGTCHLFCAAPNGLVFFLGQLSRSFGRILLYEHPFGAQDAFGKYQPSIELVVPAPKGSNW